MSSIFSLFVTCPKGLESLLADELSDLGCAQIKQTVAGVRTKGDLRYAYRCCLWSRLANKVLLSLGQCEAQDAEALYQGVRSIDWSEHLGPESTFWIDLNGTNDNLRNTQFSAQKVKDAIVDQLRTASGQRPSISRDRPDLMISIRLHRDQAAINIDLCGDSLHKRGNRRQSVIAPLKENLAAALLIRSKWPRICAEGGHLVDPMCGSGTFLLEAAMLAADIAPGIWRQEFAFERWRQHQPELWAELKSQALVRKEAGMNRTLPEIRGYDEDNRAVYASKVNAEVAGLDEMIRVIHKPLAEFKKPSHSNYDKGLLITNPPYGERLGEQETLLPLYEQLGDILKRDFGGWQASVFTGNPELGIALGLRSHKQYKFLNGTIPSELLLFEIFASEGRSASEVRPPREIVLSDGAQMVANRLRKNRRQLVPWAKKQGIECYRLYDADLPEYAAAVDIYGELVHIQEYQAPKSIDEKKAEQRLRDLQQAVILVLETDKSKISLKQRRRTRGMQQYEKATGSENVWGDRKDQLPVVQEGAAKFAIDLHTYLDSGLFLDHRLVRQRIGAMAAGKRFLNLFCYTATATVHAALGGAKSSVSVDMSHTYLKRARRNFELNNIGDHHELIQADCLAWLKNCREGFDLIFLDPPSFSNSKRMEDVLDVQRDHASLISRCMEILNPKGCLVFSTNLRKFRLDVEALEKYSVADISVETIDKDFQRNSKIHQCFLIENKPS